MISKTVPLARPITGALLLAMGGVAHAEDAALKIGAVIPLTGTYGSYGKGLSAAMNIALDDVNAAGGVLGKPVTLLIEDDQTDPTAGLNGAKKLIDVNGVNAIVGTFASSVTLPILSYASQVSIPVLTVSGAPDTVSTGMETWEA